MQGVEDFLRGVNWLMEQDGEALHKEIMQLGYKLQYTEDLKENSYWMGSIDEYLFTGMNPVKDYEQMVNSITAKDIQKFADELLKQKNEVEVTMVSPEKK